MQQNDSAKKPLIQETIEPTADELEKIKEEFNSAFGFS